MHCVLWEIQNPSRVREARNPLKLLTNRSKLPVDQVTYLGNKNGKRTYLINLREE